MNSSTVAHVRRPAIGYALYLCASFLFALNGSVSKSLLESGIPAARLSQLRVTSGFLILLVIVLLTNRQALRLKRSEIPALLLYGILGIAMTQFLYFISLQYLDIGVALLIEFTAPIMVALWFRFAKKEKQNIGVWIALAMALVGLAMVAQVWKGATLNTFGVVAAFGAAVALMIYYVSAESLVSKQNSRDPISLTMWGFAAAALFWAIGQPWWSFPWEVMGGAVPEGPLASVPQWALLSYMVVLGTVVPFLLVLSSMRHIRASQASTIGMSEPVIAAFLAWVLLGEVFLPIQIIGGAIVLAGVFLAERSR